MEKVAKFQPDMVKIRFAARIVANLSQNGWLAGALCRHGPASARQLLAPEGIGLI
jgi:hypothetical protein